MFFKKYTIKRHLKTKALSIFFIGTAFRLFLLVPLACFASPFGKDAKLIAIPTSKPPKHTAKGIGVTLSQALIRFHQEVITPIDGPRSHYLPSSSQYTLDGIEKYGFFKGWILGCDRLLRENDEAWIYPTCVNEKKECFKCDPVR